MTDDSLADFLTLMGVVYMQVKPMQKLFVIEMKVSIFIFIFVMSPCMWHSCYLLTSFKQCLRYVWRGIL